MVNGLHVYNEFPVFTTPQGTIPYRYLHTHTFIQRQRLAFEVPPAQGDQHLNKSVHYEQFGVRYSKQAKVKNTGRSQVLAGYSIQCWTVKAEGRKTIWQCTGGSRPVNQDD